MAGETTITVVGNITNDPELRQTPAGQSVANFTIASTPRVFDRQTNEWRDGETLFLRASAWRDLAENVAASLSKGMPVIAQGRLKSRKYTPKDSTEERTVIEFELETIGPSLKNATAVVTRQPRDGGGPGSSAPAASAGGSWGGYSDTEPPF